VAERKKFLLRLDPEVYDAVRRWADDDLRSVNAQIEYLLRRALDGSGRPVRPARPPRLGRPPGGHAAGGRDTEVFGGDQDGPGA
jgi:hypothetical protein